MTDTCVRVMGACEGWWRRGEWVVWKVDICPKPWTMYFRGDVRVLSVHVLAVGKREPECFTVGQLPSLVPLHLSSAETGNQRKEGMDRIKPVPHRNVSEWQLGGFPRLRLSHATAIYACMHAHRIAAFSQPQSVEPQSKFWVAFAVAGYSVNPAASISAPRVVLRQLQPPWRQRTALVNKRSSAWGRAAMAGWLAGRALALFVVLVSTACLRHPGRSDGTRTEPTCGPVQGFGIDRKETRPDSKTTDFYKSKIQSKHTFDQKETNSCETKHRSYRARARQSAKRIRGGTCGGFCGPAAFLADHIYIRVRPCMARRPRCPPLIHVFSRSFFPLCLHRHHLFCFLFSLYSHRNPIAAASAQRPAHVHTVLRM